MKLFAIVWLPDDVLTAVSKNDVLRQGGRIIDTRLPKHEAQKVLNCLRINGEDLSGHYSIIPENILN